MWIELLLIVGIILCGFQAVRVGRLLTAVIWLAVSSALVATTLYGIGAPEVAVIELSVGAGLVTVMFVFAIAIAGEDAMQDRALVAPLLAWLLIVAMAVLLSWTLWPLAQVETPVAEAPFATVLWQERSLDVLLQIGLIFAGVLGIVGLLSEPAGQRAEDSTAEPSTKATAEVPDSPSVAHRDLEKEPL